jgi:hypothetical protein
MKVLGSAVLAFEAIVVLLATALATSNGSVADTRLAWVLGLVLMALLFAGIGTLRRPWGVAAGWVLQGLVLATSIVVGWSMVIIGGIFVVLWFVAVRTGRRVDALREAARDQSDGGTTDT